MQFSSTASFLSDVENTWMRGCVQSNCVLIAFGSSAGSECLAPKVLLRCGQTEESKA